MFKKLIIGLLTLVVIIVLAGSFLWSNMDSLIKTAVEKYGSEATKTTVLLDKVKLSIASGEGAISGFRVSNPKGFSSASAIQVGAVSVKVDAKSVAGNGPIVIDEIAIDGPQISYEVKTDGNSNLQTIQQNVMEYAGAGKAAAKPADKNEETSGEERKLIIKHFYVRGGQVSVAHELMGDKPLNSKLPEIHLSNIGKSSGGATAAQIAEQVIGSITSGAMSAANVDLAKELGNMKGAVEDKIKGAVGNQLNKVGVPLDGLFGQ